MRGAVALVFLAAACEGGPTPVALPGEVPPPCVLASEFHLITSIDLPDPMDSEVMIWDLDGDGYRENRLGNFLQHLFVAGAGLEETLASAITQRTLLVVIEVQRCAETADDHARVSLWEGTSVTAQDGELNVNATAATLVPAVGSADGAGLAVATAGYAAFPLTALLDLGAEENPAPWLSSAAIRIEFDRDTGTGLLAFGTDAVAVRASAPDALGRSYSSLLSTAPGCPDACESPVLQVIATFDADGDDQISADEISNQWDTYFEGYLVLLCRNTRAPAC